MRVAVVTTSYPRNADDAAGHFVRTEARTLCAKGHAVVVLAPAPVARTETDPTGLSVEWIDDRGACGWPGVLARLRADPLRSVGLARFAGVAAWRLRAGHFDRVIAHWLVPCAVPIALAGRAPLEAVAHGSDVRLLLAMPALRRLVIGSLVVRRAHVRFVSHALRDALLARDRRLEPLSSVQASPIDVAGAPDRASARSLLAVGDARLAVIVSRLVPAKRVDVALGAAGVIPATRVVVIGDGPERGALERAFPAATFTGQLPHADALMWISAADVVLCASREEGAPTVVREARALGVPVVAAPAGDVALWAAADPGISVVRARP